MKLIRKEYPWFCSGKRPLAKTHFVELSARLDCAGSMNGMQQGYLFGYGSHPCFQKSFALLTWVGPYRLSFPVSRRGVIFALFTGSRILLRPAFRDPPHQQTPVTHL